MGVFEQFPYANMHEMNLDWLLKKMKELDAAMETFKATESLKFADPIIWDIATQYQKSTIVLDPTGNAYLSLQPVPAGVQLNNGEYWLEIFNFTDYTRTANRNLTVNVETNTTRATATYQVDDWLIWEDVLYRVTSPIAIDDAFIVAPAAGSNIVHFTVEDFIKAFITYATNLIIQYKNDIDASELAYRQQLAQDIATTTHDLTVQLNQAIAGATVDSEVIDARIGWNNTVYTTLGIAIRTQITDLHNLIDQEKLRRIAVILTSSSDTYADLDTLPIPSIACYTGGTTYAIHTPHDGVAGGFTVTTLNGFSISSYTGAVQILTYALSAKTYVRMAWGSPASWSGWLDMTFTEAELALETIMRDPTNITGTLPSGSPYLDLDTFPVNTYAFYNNPNNTIAHRPNTDVYKYFNILSFEANNGVTQIIFNAHGNAYYRSRPDTSSPFTDWHKFGVFKKTINLTSSSDTYADLDSLPIDSEFIYASGTAYAVHTPHDGVAGLFTVYTKNAYSDTAYLGAVQMIVYTTGRAYIRSASGSPVTWTSWKEITYDLNDLKNDAIVRNKTVITGTLSDDSPYLDLDTIPVNTYTVYQSPTNSIAHMPPETGKNFNIMSFMAYSGGLTTAVTQLIFFQNGSVYSRMSWGASNAFTQWQKLTGYDKTQYYHDAIYKKVAMTNSTTFLFFGDSITQGMTSYISGGEVHISVQTGYVGYFTSITGCNVTNKGVSRSGFVANSTMTTILDALQHNSLTADYLVVAGGTNDYGVSMPNEATFRAAVISTFDYIDAHSSAQVIVLLPINRVTKNANSQGLYLADYRQILFDEAIKRDYLIVDCDYFFPDTPGTETDLVVLDTLHPTDLGHKMYAKSLISKFI